MFGRFPIYNGGLTSCFGGKEESILELEKESIKKKQSFEEIKARKDLESTVFSSCCEKCNKETKIKFKLNHALYTFVIRIEGFIVNGSTYGSSSKTINCMLPFYINCKIPKYLCHNDIMNLPIVVYDKYVFFLLFCSLKMKM